MDEAAANGHLEVVKWLHANRSEGCTSRAKDKSAAKGNVEMVKWLHANRSEGFTHVAIHSAAVRGQVAKWLLLQSSQNLRKIVMDVAVVRGNLVLVQWLHTEAKLRCTAQAMIYAATHGHLEVLKYLYSHRPKGPALTKCAIAAERAIINGHFGIAHWCFEHFPARAPRLNKIPTRNSFESLLLLHEYYSETFTADQVAKMLGKAQSSAPAEFTKWLSSLV